MIFKNIPQQTGIIILFVLFICIFSCKKDESDSISGDEKSCPESPVVTFGGKTYNTVLIGEQCWMRENLDVGIMITTGYKMQNNKAIEKYCYDNDEANCEEYGGLYLWDEMMQYDTIEGVQGICPPGWHIPTDEEWCTLTKYIDSTVDCAEDRYSGLDCGIKMKSTSGWFSLHENGNGTNESGFSALPGGYLYNTQIFDRITKLAYFWSSTKLEYDSYSAWQRHLKYNNHLGVGRNYINKQSSLSVRCIRN